MADINIQKKEGAGVPPWLWIIGALLALGLLWFLMKGCNNPDANRAVNTVDSTAGAMVDTTGAMADRAGDAMSNAFDNTYTDLSTVNEPYDSYYGKNVQMSGVVESVPYDEGFFLRSDNNRVMFVGMKTGGAESMIDVNKGDRVTVGGPLTKLDGSGFDKYVTNGKYTMGPGMTATKTAYIEVPAGNVHKMGMNGMMSDSTGTM